MSRRDLLDPPPEPRDAAGFPIVADDDLDVFGVESAAAALARRLEAIPEATVEHDGEARGLLSPPFSPVRDRIAGPPWAMPLVVFGSFASRSSRPLGALLHSVRNRYPAAVRIAWRHDPDLCAHPRSLIFALAAESAAPRGRFWVLARELLRLRHTYPRDLHDAIVRAELDMGDSLDSMRGLTGAERIAEDVASARASGVLAGPAVFIDGRRYQGQLTTAGLTAALDSALRRRA